MTSSVRVRLPSLGYTYTFTGVLSVKHEYSLKLQTDSDSADGSDYINGARNQPDRVILSVAESDVMHSAGWSDRMLQAMESVKRSRVLCEVVTSARTYSGMLLSEFSAVADETSQSGWQGTLTFTRTSLPAVPVKTNDNASMPVNTGSAGAVQTVSDAGTSSPFRQMLARANVYL